MKEWTGQVIFVCMKDKMKNRYRIFRRGWGVYYAFDTLTRNSQSLKTEDRRNLNQLARAAIQRRRPVQKRFPVHPPAGHSILSRLPRQSLRSAGLQFFAAVRLGRMRQNILLVPE